MVNQRVNVFVCFAFSLNRRLVDPEVQVPAVEEAAVVVAAAAAVAAAVVPVDPPRQARLLQPSISCKIH